MLLINCPHCGLRNQDEFVYGGDVEHRRPENPQNVSDADWCEYIYTVPNTKGWAREYWWHVRGCQRWSVIERNSEDNALRDAQQGVDIG